MAADNSSVLSSATRNVLQAYMNKHDIPPMLRRKFLLAAEKGKSLLDVVYEKPKTPIKSKKICREPSRSRVHFSNKPSIRPRSKIVQMGAYEREKFNPSLASTLTIKEKEKFQNIMAFGKNMALDLTINKDHHEEDDEDLPINEVKFREILKEIEERQDFLRDMTKLGKGNQFAAQIEFEIKQRIRELEALDINKLRAEVENCHHSSKK